jgi:ATP-binding cassette, subfamily B, bacterial
MTAAMIDDLIWPMARAGEALEALARHARLGPAARDIPAMPSAVQSGTSAEVARWVDWAARQTGVEAEPIAATAGALPDILHQAGPALLYLPKRSNQPGGFLVILATQGRNTELIGSDLRVRSCRSAALQSAICAPLAAPHLPAINRLLDTAEVNPERRDRAREGMLAHRLAKQEVGLCWLLRPSPQTSFWQQLKQARVPRKVAWMLGAFAVVYGLEIIGWGLIGQITLNGRLDMGWLAGWALLVLSLVPLRLLGGWLDTSFALEVGRLLKTRLLAGILNMDLDVLRKLGAGQLLSRVMESQALESLALNGGMGVLIALLELAFAATILASGAGDALHLGLLLIWMLLTLGLSYRYFQRMQSWTLMRLDMTHTLVERMVGHRTRLAQERAHAQGEDDQALRDYLDASKALDRAIVPAAVVMPRGWMLVGLLGLLPAFVTGTGDSASFAIALGGMLLANRAMGGISDGLASLSRARVAWTQVASLFNSSRPQALNEPFLSASQMSGADKTNTRTPLIDASQLTFRYRAQGQPVLSQVDLRIDRGEKILLEGPSGGGKSTLASLLVGLRKPDSGLLLINGLDRHTLGDAWHQLATEAPQFHENHILSGTLAFNLLMGRNWPANDDELADAKALCIELGLGELLERMPSGLMQMVGETGWQLSHGERSRIFLARALLQNTQLTILDESFAALDPQTLDKCLRCALARATTLLVIAHP